LLLRRRKGSQALSGRKRLTKSLLFGGENEEISISRGRKGRPGEESSYDLGVGLSIRRPGKVGGREARLSLEDGRTWPFKSILRVFIYSLCWGEPQKKKKKRKKRGKKKRSLSMSYVKREAFCGHSQREKEKLKAT